MTSSLSLPFAFQETKFFSAAEPKITNLVRRKTVVYLFNQQTNQKNQRFRPRVWQLCHRGPRSICLQFRNTPRKEVGWFLVLLPGTSWHLLSCHGRYPNLPLLKCGLSVHRSPGNRLLIGANCTCLMYSTPIPAYVHHLHQICDTLGYERVPFKLEHMYR